MDSKSIQIGNTAYAYYEIPNPGKPKLLLLHGMIVESHCFEKMAGFLREHFHLVLLDLKGHGKSGDGRSYDEDYTNEAITRDLLAFSEAVIGEPFHLLGYSLGGQYALKFAGTHPDKILRLIIIDSAPAVSGKGIFAILYALMTTPRRFKDEAHLRRHYDRRIPGLGDYILAYCARRDAAGHLILRYDKKRFAPDTMAKGIARARDIWQASTHITAPTLILRAGQSLIISDKFERMMKANIAKAEVVRMPGMGHNLVFTHPRDVAEQILAFLKG